MDEHIIDTSVIVVVADLLRQNLGGLNQVIRKKIFVKNAIIAVDILSSLMSII
jgi:hypothetical protein